VYSGMVDRERRWELFAHERFRRAVFVYFCLSPYISPSLCLVTIDMLPWRYIHEDVS
jgi:hypothetical protein